jgi:hypothetical protein
MVVYLTQPLATDYFQSDGGPPRSALGRLVTFKVITPRSALGRLSTSNFFLLLVAIVAGGQFTSQDLARMDN